MLQDDSRELSRWLSNRPDARHVVRENAKEIQMSNDKTREEFVAWALQRGHYMTAYSRGDQAFRDHTVQMMFQAWKESRDRSQASVPAGWKLVPVEPTEAMLGAVEEEVGGHCHSCTAWHASWDDCRRVWAAMVAASQDLEQ